MDYDCSSRISRWRLTLSIGVLIAVLLAGCSSNSAAKGGAASATASTATAGGAASAAYKRVRIAFLPLVQANPYVAATLKGIQQYGAANNASVQVFDANLSASKQFSQCQDAITSKNFDAFIVIPVDASISGCLQSAIKQGIAVVNTDFPIGPNPASGVPQISGQAGSVLDPASLRGKWILDLVVGACGSTPKCKFALITGLLADPYSQAVIQAVKDGLKDHPTLELAAVREGLYLADPSLKVSQDVLQANPDLSVIATTSDPMTLGAEQAVKGAGLTGKVKLIGGGASSASVPAITSGRWYGTFLSLPTNEGSLGAELAVQAARGAKMNVGESAVQKSGLPAEITKDNIDQLTSKAFEAQW